MLTLKLNHCSGFIRKAKRDPSPAKYVTEHPFSWRGLQTCKILVWMASAVV